MIPPTRSVLAVVIGRLPRHPPTHSLLTVAFGRPPRHLPTHGVPAVAVGHVPRHPLAQRHPRVLLGAAALCVALAGCADAPDAAEQGSPSDELQGSWRLSDGTGPEGTIATVDEYHPTLEIDGDDWSGSICNSYGGTAVVADDGAVALGDVFQTEMACTSDGAMESEAAYLEAFRRIETVERIGRHLVLRGEDVELVFRAVEIETEPDLTGTTWQLTSLLTGDAPDIAVSEAMTPAELRFGDGRLTGTTGCRDLAGPYHRDGPLLDLTEVGADDVVCDLARVDQDDHVTAVLLSRTGIRADIDGDQLTLTRPDGRGLVYQAN